MAIAGDQRAGSDQTILDVEQAIWQPLEVDGLPAGAEISSLRGDLSRGAAEILLRLPAGYVVPNHTHTSDETYVWLAGAFTFVGSDGVRTKFNGPAFISLPGNAPPHKLECGVAAACVLYVRYNHPFDILYPPKVAHEH
jgi:hypothetical protein